jgi:hypothetical protein
MPDAVMDAGTTRWPSETPCKPSSLWSSVVTADIGSGGVLSTTTDQVQVAQVHPKTTTTVVAKKSPWRSFKKSSSKISPRLSPPKDLPKKASSMSHEKKTKPTGSKVLANEKSSQDFLQQNIHGEIGQAHHDKTSSVDDNIVVVFQNGRMVNDKVEELRLGLEEEQEQSHDDVHEISSAVARGMSSKTYDEKKIASHAGFKAPNDEEDYDQRTTLQTPAALKESLVKKRQGGILQSNIATDSTLNSSSSNNHCLAALSSAEVGTHKSIPIAFLDAYMKDEGPAIDSDVGP